MRRFYELVGEIKATSDALDIAMTDAEVDNLLGRQAELVAELSRKHARTVQQVNAKYQALRAACIDGDYWHGDVERALLLSILADIECVAS